MRTTLIALSVAVAAMAAPLVSAAAAAWRTHSLAEAGFSVDAPEGFALMGEKTTADGVRLRGYNVALGDLALIVTSADGRQLPPDAWQGSPDDMADAVVEGAIRNVETPRVAKFPVPGGAGRRLTYSHDGKSVRAEILLRRPWIIHVSVTAQSSQAELLNSPEADRFIASLRLSSDPTG